VGSDGRISRKDANRSGIMTSFVLNRSVRKQPRTTMYEKNEFSSLQVQEKVRYPVLRYPAYG
jgi:hypothetical protein